MSEQSTICPACHYNHLSIAVENGEMIFSCENCGWQKIEQNYFYLTAWHVEINQALAPIDILQSLLTDEQIVEFLRPRLSGVSYLSGYTDASDEYLLGEVHTAHQVYLKQMVVLATTYLELILSDFFRCLFIAQPRRMNAYLSPEGKGKAMVSLNEILDTPSKDELIMKLTKQAASRASKSDKVVERIVSDCKLRLDKPSFIKDLGDLNELRNRIVHEDRAEKEIHVRQVHNNFGLLIYLLYVLGQAAKAYQIPYLDESNFLDDFEKQLHKN